LWNTLWMFKIQSSENIKMKNLHSVIIVIIIIIYSLFFINGLKNILFKYSKILISSINQEIGFNIYISAFYFFKIPFSSNKILRAPLSFFRTFHLPRCICIFAVHLRCLLTVQEPLVLRLLSPVCPFPGHLSFDWFWFTSCPAGCYSIFVPYHKFNLRWKSQRYAALSRARAGPLYTTDTQIQIHFDRPATITDYIWNCLALAPAPQSTSPNPQSPQPKSKKAPIPRPVPSVFPILHDDFEYFCLGTSWVGFCD